MGSSFYHLAVSTEKSLDDWLPLDRWWVKSCHVCVSRGNMVVSRTLVREWVWNLLSLLHLISVERTVMAQFLQKTYGTVFSLRVSTVVAFLVKCLWINWWTPFMFYCNLYAVRVAISCLIKKLILLELIINLWRLTQTLRKKSTGF